MSPSLLAGAWVGLALSSVALGAPRLATKRNAGSQVVTPCTSPFTPWTYVGCYDDSVHNPSTLPFDTFGPFNNMTVELCISSCKGNGYRYAGLEYYGSCFCGDAIQGTLDDPSLCDTPCTGNTSETCGGANALSVWEDPTFPPVNPSTTSDYVSLGCYTEASDNNRALIFQQNVDSSTLTTEICLSACKAMGMPYAGTEYSGECYCGTFLNPGSVPTTSDQCNMPCNGDPSEICGGSRILNLYYASDLVSTQPCGYVPSPPATCSGTAYGYAGPELSVSFTSLGIGSNWGWVIFGLPLIQGTLIEGAGGNDISKGTDVGSFTIANVGGALDVTYTITDSGCSLQDTHLYVGSSTPSKIAPGQFGHTQNFPTGTTTYTYNLPYSPLQTNFILQADVSCPCSS
jgi:hypothetical protein